MTTPLNLIRTQPYTEWAPDVTPEVRADLRRQLEQGAVLYFPNLKFHFQPGEERFLDARWSDGKSKNINLRADEQAVRGAVGSEQDLADLYALIRRYADASETLIHTLFPEYVTHMTRAGTSLRPSEIAGRPVSRRLPSIGLDGNESTCRRVSSLRQLTGRPAISLGRSDVPARVICVTYSGNSVWISVSLESA